MHCHERYGTGKAATMQRELLKLYDPSLHTRYRPKEMHLYQLPVLVCRAYSSRYMIQTARQRARRHP